MNGCWALMLAFEESLNLGFDGAFVHQSPLSWIARNSSKAGRDGDSETWVVHAAAEWTEAHIDDSPEEIRPVLIEEFWNAVGQTRVGTNLFDTCIVGDSQSPQQAIWYQQSVGTDLWISPRQLRALPVR